MNKNVLRSLSYGVYAVSTLDGDRAVGCIANSIIQVTYDTVAVSMNHENFTHECMEKNKKFAISILAEDTEMNTIAFLGFQSGRDRNKFEKIETIDVNGLSVVKNAAGYLICEVVDKLDTETHTIFIGKILDGEIIDEAKTPMTYAYYHKVKKGNSPKKAPTYLG
ncbi:MAG: flavin reductase family protein [Cyanobacteria bacterium RUI128]|nr:flavin reductase family protein [Cyanobacteria bacterium RUI128]